MKLARLAASVALLAALAVLSSGGLTGQDKDKKGPEPARKPAKGVPAHWDKLELTEAQQAELVKLYAEYLPRRQKLREEMHRLDAELARKRVGVLNDEQRKKLVDVVLADPPKEKAAETGKADPPEKEKPKGKDPDK
jgi:Spy/CpxP family protein refolding chaperone